MQINHNTVTVGSRVVVPAGAKVLTNYGRISKPTSTRVTVRKVKATRAGNTKIFWKSNGYLVSTILKPGI